ncbi:unnamed protein product (macronuclear) [Paramecium tetraurelia]|uniref:Uncharacterized protein n=1 Tax=Paramecium tetraurelia TaxID=5888 RepID=A0DMZ1_PARTE|nr:uncharacterized protein GSPATT00018613001 [Paramecium tetraurelia]CAK84408.1 unnamed protein product [Paramecium tetraurelia]|eukprot:XP_001451805.1 hypothetical protein (macronuclear) [Paramecium tetraurelia strain d4-2]
MFSNLGNYANNLVQAVGAALIAPPTKSVFLTKGMLTPEEFINAGDRLISNGGNWKWCKAISDQYKNKYLPNDKQFLIQENIISYKRIKDLNRGGTFTEQQEGEDVTIIRSEEQPIQEITQSQDRYYTLYITYDLYYFTPRLYLSGKVDDRQLTYQEVKEDVSGEYADKTVTEENFLELNIKLPTIHPCKHADTLKFFVDQMRDNGCPEEKIHPDNSLTIFLKFMNSVIPTIQFDFVNTIEL